MVHATVPGPSVNEGSFQPRLEVKESDSINTAQTENSAPTNCQWRGCHAVFDGAEALYRHLCDDHVGRNSKNNLCLTCGWDNCQASYSKRDHITSHIRIHIPMKPFSCTVCGKSFKRSQDLKKHGRTHIHPSPTAEKSSDDGKVLETSVAQTTAPSTPSLYPSLPGLLSPIARDDFASTPSCHSGTSRDSASPAPSSYSIPQETSPRGSSLAYHCLEHGQTRYGPADSMYPALPKAQILEETNHSRFHPGHDYDGQTRRYPTSPHQGSNWYTGTKRPRRSVDEFWGDVRRRKVAPVYDNNMADRLNQILTPGCAQDPGLLDLFLGDSLNALGPFGSLETPPSTMGGDRAYGISTASYDHHFGRNLPATQPARPNCGLSDINSWLLQLGMSMTQSTNPLPPMGPSVDAPQPSIDFSQSLNSLGLMNIPGIDNLGLDPTQLGSAPAMGIQDHLYTSRPIESSHAQLAVRDTSIQPTYRHVEPLTRAPVTLHERRSPSPTYTKEEPMDMDDESKLAHPVRPKMYPRLPGDTQPSPVEGRSRTSTPTRWEPCLPRATREHHLNLVLNVLLALNKRQRLDPQSGRIVSMNESRERARAPFMHAPLRNNARERTLPKPVLYDLPSRRSSLQTPPMLNASMRPPRPSMTPKETEEKSPPRPGALPSISSLLSHLDTN